MQLAALESAHSKMCYNFPQTNFIADQRAQHYQSNYRQKKNTYCGFCKKNGEPEDFYKSHVSKLNGKTTCPVLQSHKCELCGATGENAHTRSYYPTAFLGQEIFRDDPRNRSYFHNHVVLKHTPRNSSGKRRFL